MPRRSETPAAREARDRVKRRFDAQLAAINDFFTQERRIETLRTDVETLESEQAESVTDLVEATTLAHPAEIVGWPLSQVGPPNRSRVCRTDRRRRLDERLASNHREGWETSAVDLPGFVRRLDWLAALRAVGLFIETLRLR